LFKVIGFAEANCAFEATCKPAKSYIPESKGLGKDFGLLEFRYNTAFLTRHHLKNSHACCLLVFALFDNIRVINLCTYVSLK
jgi:hypothetical protein